MLLPSITVDTFPALANLATTPLSEKDIEAILNLGIAGDIILYLPSLSEPILKNIKPLIFATRLRVGPFTAKDIDLAVQWLDAGVIATIFDLEIPNPNDPSSSSNNDTVGTLVEAISSLPAGRVMVRFTGPYGLLDGKMKSSAPSGILATISAIKSLINAVIIPIQTIPVPTSSETNIVSSSTPIATINSSHDISSETIRAINTSAGHHVSVLFENTDKTMVPTDIGRYHRHNIHVISSGNVAMNNEEIELGAAEGKLDIGTCISLCARSDRADGLFTTVVSDENGITLGLVYSSVESIIEAVRTKRGIYYSRSRNGLWRKGDTSGAYQSLKHIHLDCDSDALLFTVHQHGNIPAFCHLNTRTCWGEDKGLPKLERTLSARLIDAPPGSYTKRLFDDPKLLHDKLMEEAAELSEAQTPDHIAAEAADLIYFALVKCAKSNVTLADIEKHLDHRTLKVRRRAGDSKPYRIAAAQAYLEAMGKNKSTNGGNAEEGK